MDKITLARLEQRDDALRKIKSLLAVAKACNDAGRNALESAPENSPEAMRCLLSAQLINGIELHFGIHERAIARADESALARADFLTGIRERITQKGAQQPQ